MHDLTIAYRRPDELSENPRNVRTHSKRQIRQIANSIQAFGFANPILIDENDQLIAGHGRLAAAKNLKLDRVPVVQLAGLSEAQKRGLMLADNKIADNAGWDNELLTRELADLSSLDLDFELDDIGFETAEIDLAIESQGDEVNAETAPEPHPACVSVTKPGDLWGLGPHRVFCGNARSEDDIRRLMGDGLADAVFTDPPFNVRINGHAGGKGKVKHSEFAEASGEMNDAEFGDFLAAALGIASAFSRPGSVHFVCMDWRHAAQLGVVGAHAIGPQINLCVWVKTNGGMGSLYRSKHELVLVFAKAGATHRNNVQLGRFGRNRTNVWHYAGVNTFREGRLDELRAHPTAKPVMMVKDAILDVTKRGDIVLDPFAGAGATLMAAERSGRVARLLEIDPAYVDVTLRRWRDETGEDPVRADDGVAFSSLEADGASHE
jgi:DNA modification methylase